MDIDIDELSVFSDKRGVIAELFTRKDIKKRSKSFGHLFFVTFRTRKAIRGNHYHKRKHEYYIVISGKVKVILFDIGSKKKKIVTISNRKNKFTRLRIGPNIAHACYSMVPTSLMIGYFSGTYNRNKDTHKYILISKI